MSDNDEGQRKGRGRPPIVLTPLQKQKIAHYAQLGIPMDKIGVLIGVSERSIWNQIKDDPELSALYETAKYLRLASVAESLYTLTQFRPVEKQIRIKNKKTGKWEYKKRTVLVPPKLEAIKFMLKTQGKWNFKDEPLGGSGEHILELDLGALGSEPENIEDYDDAADAVPDDTNL